MKNFKNILNYKSKSENLLKKNRLRFDQIISDKRFNYLEKVFENLFEDKDYLTDEAILNAYFNFSDKMQSNSFAIAELEWTFISVLCQFRPNLTETLLKRPLLAIVYSIGDDIDWFTVKQFIDKRILAKNAEPYGGLPPEPGLLWLEKLLPNQKEKVQKILEIVIEENRQEIEKLNNR
ncbi:hypothetical protein [Flavobacterium gyeonganense]|uniref:Uncharacterized protein n=1 Tax=Flavobacterium gyeonganense TaxID=1310418 RepID=A0ABV5H9H6_9FLAO|nr:hypothetical protein [Flavobacterium gyeonganense]